MTPAEKTRAWMTEVCRKHDVDIKLLQLPGRRVLKVEVAAMREICVGLKDRGWSCVRTASFLNKNHTTVLHHLRKSKIKT